MSPPAERFVAYLVDGAHPADAAGEEALLDEAGQRGLGWQRGVPVGHVLGDSKGAAQRRGRHHEAQYR